MLLEVQELYKRYATNNRWLGFSSEFLSAVEGVSFGIRRGETVGLVGESGCGKTTLAMMLVRLIEPDSGRILFNGQDITRLSQYRFRPIRRRIQMIFQDPYASLNPRMKVKNILEEPLIVHELGDSESRRKRVEELLEIVGLPKKTGERYPHAFSGGQRQRIGIARALSLNPDLIIADEPVSSLDVSIQAEILKLLGKLQKELNLTYLFISHDLRIVSNICDKILVMNQGEIVEMLETKDLARAKDPYTQKLLAAVPLPDPGVRKKRRVLASSSKNG